MRNFVYARADNVEQAIALYARGSGTVFLAGGTTLLDLMKLDIMQPAHVVDIHKLGLDQIEILDGNRVRIGAMVSAAPAPKPAAVRPAQSPRRSGNYFRALPTQVP